MNELIEEDLSSLRNTLPSPTDKNRPQAEQQCLLAGQYLRDTTQRGGDGLKGRDAKSPFLASILSQTKPLTAPQLRSVVYIVGKYRDMLSLAGFHLPTQDEIDACLQEKEQQGQGRRQDGSCVIDIVDGKITFSMPYYRADWKVRFDEFRTVFANQMSADPEHWFGTARTFKPCYQGATKTWEMPFSQPIYQTLLASNFFPLATTLLGPGARAHQAALEEAEFAKVLRIAQESEAQLRRYQELLSAIGGLEMSFGNGKRLYKHQQEALEILLKRDRFLVADETGLGKTLEAAFAALARQRIDGCRIYVITTVSSMDMWLDTFAELGGSCEVFSWSPKSIPDKNADYPFVLIADEAHKACNEESQCTQKFLALSDHEQCRGVYALTGTPMPNGRPVNLYPLLLAVHHPLVWDRSLVKRNSLKYKYLERYCGRQRKYIGNGTYVWDNNGATYLWDLNRRTQYVPGAAENHADACQIARLKMECTDLPEKQRSLVQAEISEADGKLFQEAVIKLWDQFEEHVKEKIEVFRLEFTEKNGTAPEKEVLARKEKSIRRAQAIVSYSIFRHAGALAKLSHALEMAKVILEPAGRKLVIFTSFVNIAKTLGAQLEELYGNGSVGYILGSSERAERVATMADFQNPAGRSRIIISTAAGGESITLTEAQHMIVIDRPWTPGMVKQWEDRIHRMTTTGTVTIYWLQLPKWLSEADLLVDATIQAKQINIDAYQYGRVSAGMHFHAEEELKDQAESILYATRKRIRRRSKSK